MSKGVNTLLGKQHKNEWAVYNSIGHVYSSHYSSVGRAMDCSSTGHVFKSHW